MWAATRPTDASLAGLALPDGAVVHGIDGQLLGWESAAGVRGDLSQLWLRCALEFPSTGLWPLCDSVRIRPTRAWDHPRTDEGRPYWRDPYAVPADVYHAAGTADRDGYLDDTPDCSMRELMEEFGLTSTDQTLALASVLPNPLLRRLVAPAAPKRICLVACRRPSDVVLLLDFGIPNDDATPGIFTGVLRSWEERFAVLPVMLDPAWTAFQALAPPTDHTEIDRLAAEAFCFATDTATQGGFHRTHATPYGNAREMVQSREWLIWWD